MNELINIADLVGNGDIVKSLEFTILGKWEWLFFIYLTIWHLFKIFTKTYIIVIISLCSKCLWSSISIKLEIKWKLLWDACILFSKVVLIHIKWMNYVCMDWSKSTKSSDRFVMLCICMNDMAWHDIGAAKRILAGCFSYGNLRSGL